MKLDLGNGEVIYFLGVEGGFWKVQWMKNHEVSSIVYLNKEDLLRTLRLLT